MVKLPQERVDELIAVGHGMDALIASWLSPSRIECPSTGTTGYRYTGTASRSG